MKTIINKKNNSAKLKFLFVKDCDRPKQTYIYIYLVK